MNIDKVLKNFGNNVQKEREKNNMTIKELSKRTKISEKYLIKIEKGEAKGIPISYVFRLAKGLNILPDELCFGI